MKPIVLVLFVAAGAFAAPSVVLNEYSENELPRSNSLTERAFGLIDGGDVNIHILNLQAVLKDLSERDPRSQALAFGQTLGVLVDLATGIPGDSCASAALINAYAAGVKSGNFSGFRSVLYNFVHQLASNLKLIVKLASNPASVRFSTGPSGNCLGSGRSYQFEAAWDAILSSSSSSRSNNVGATITALSLPPVAQVLEAAGESTSHLLRAVASGYDASAAAASASKALLRAVERIQL
ncbi:hypothetical protein O3G_MSEX009920 [Manduca sexta]|uniref:L-fibroin n=1 Tax=Manduca sexta TaxID=7130 RepID=A0A921ZH61_MANSE|nr:hypothetical protein O3G_MSEX009920 [Manduca sexta]